MANVGLTVAWMLLHSAKTQLRCLPVTTNMLTRKSASPLPSKTQSKPKQGSTIQTSMSSHGSAMKSFFITQDPGRDLATLKMRPVLAFPIFAARSYN